MIRIGLIGDNSVEYIEILFDLWNRGYSVVLLDWRIPAIEANTLLNEAQVHKCYIQEKFVEKYKQEFKEIEVLSYICDFNKASWIPKKIVSKYDFNNSDEEALVLYSSGTTGRSKGIKLSHRAINLNAQKSIDIQALNKEYLYLIKPFSHSSSIVSSLLVGIRTNSNILVSPTIFTPRFYLNTIKNNEISVLHISPAILRVFSKENTILNYTFPKLKNIRVGGGMIDENLIEFAKERFADIPIYNGYGLTETGPAVAAQGPNEKFYVAGSVGKVLKGVDVKIIKSSEKVASKYEKGIIHVNTDSMYDGYINGCEKVSMYKGWFNSGDIGYFDEHENLYILGRSDNMLSISSHNVFPEEIERKIIKLDNSLTDCMVTTLCNDICGEELVCYYSTDFTKLNEQKIKELCQKELANYEIPKRFIEVSYIKYSTNGKKDRNYIYHESLSK